MLEEGEVSITGFLHCPRTVSETPPLGNGRSSMSEPEEASSQRRDPLELRGRAVRMVHEAIAADGTRTGAASRGLARQLGIGVESLRELGQAGGGRRGSAFWGDERGAPTRG